MGTRSLTRVKDESGNILLTMYRQFDGYVEGGHGDELIGFLSGMVITNGISLGKDRPKKSANGMGCLAAQLVSHFKEGVGGVYIEPNDSVDQEFNYTIELVNDVLTLSYEGHGESGVLLGNTDTEDSGVEPVVEFLYPSKDGYEDVWRKIQVTDRDDTYITGYDLNEGKRFKRFLVEKIVGGPSKVFTVNK